MIRTYIFKYEMECLTGLMIGAGNTSFEIGGVDSPVLKEPMTGKPYVPGSSIKGKMRCLFELTEAIDFVIDEYKGARDKELDKREKKQKNGNGVLDNPKYIKNEFIKLFGVNPSKSYSEEIDDEEIFLTRGIFRDAYLKNSDKLESFLGKGVYTEVKAENVIDRLTSKATPRFFERVPKGAIFEGEVLIKIFNEDDEKLVDCLKRGLKLLQDNYLGAGGSRGSGAVKFIIRDVIIRNKDYYLGKEDEIHSVDIIKKFNDFLS